MNISFNLDFVSLMYLNVYVIDNIYHNRWTTGNYLFFSTTTTTDTVNTSTTTRFILISFCCSNVMWRLEPTHISFRFHFMYGYSCRFNKLMIYTLAFKAMKSKHRHVGRCRLRNWGLVANLDRWLKTLHDRTQDRWQWLRSIQLFSSFKCWITVLLRVYLFILSYQFDNDYFILFPIYHLNSISLTSVVWLQLTVQQTVIKVSIKSNSYYQKRLTSI